MLYISLSTEETEKLKSIAPDVYNLVFRAVGSSFVPIWVGMSNGSESARIVRLMVGDELKSSLFEISSGRLLELPSESLKESLAQHLFAAE